MILTAPPRRLHSDIDVEYTLKPFGPDHAMQQSTHPGSLSVVPVTELDRKDHTIDLFIAAVATGWQAK